ncbi:MAG: PTS sugar transporter subunit IIA [Nitrospirae bacterium]|nr:PTS sugar transporter subunit IIA [Nitrospirota bacterium]
MKLSNLMREDLICLNLRVEKKRDGINEIVDLLARTRGITDRDKFLRAIMEREKLASTGVGEGVAIPHARTEAAKEMVIAFARSEKGVDFDSLDKEPVYLIFMIAAPEKPVEPYLKALARISRLLGKKPFKESLRKAKSPQEVIEVIKETEK